jgi:hypothetical protein
MTDVPPDVPPGGARRAAKSRRAEKPSRAERARRKESAPAAERPRSSRRKQAEPAAEGRSQRVSRPTRSLRPPRIAAVADAGAPVRVTGAVLAVGALALALTTGSGAQGRPEATQVGDLVSHQTIACPSQPAPGGATSTFVEGTLGVVGLGSGGDVRQGPVADSGTTLKTPVRGRLSTLEGTSAAAVLTATGQLAAGLFGYRVDESGNGGTLAVAPCLAPRASWWFTGGGASLDHSSRLELANVDAGPAVVDLRVLGPDGEVETVGTRGITIAPGQEKSVPLDSIAPQTADLTLGVHATRGRVLASVDDGYAPVPGAAQGREFLRGDVDPSRVVRIAGLPTRASARTLLISNPSDQDAVVDVEAAGKSGRFVPAGLDSQVVPPGTTVSVKLPGSVGQGDATALLLRSQVPVLGTVRSVDGNDVTDAPAVLPIDGEAAAPVLRGARAFVQLTAGSARAKATVTAYDARGNEAGRTTLSVPPRATASWSPANRAAYVDVAPLSGAVHGAVVYRGTGVTAFPLIPLPIRLVQPIVVQSLR